MRRALFVTVESQQKNQSFSKPGRNQKWRAHPSRGAVLRISKEEKGETINYQFCPLEVAHVRRRRLQDVSDGFNTSHIIHRLERGHLDTLAAGSLSVGAWKVHSAAQFI